MRIGVNANYFQKPSTGIGVVTLEFMRALKELSVGQDHEWIWYFEGTVPAGEWPTNWRFERVTIRWQRDDIPHRYLWERFALPRAVRQDHCEVFFNLYQSATLLPREIRHIMLVHDLIPKRFPEYLRNLRQRLYYRAIERAIVAADQILTPSQATKSDLEHFLNVPDGTINIVPLGVAAHFQNPIPLDTARAILEHYGLRPGYLYHGGGLEQRKNTALVLEAYVQMVRASSDGSRPPKLVISGTLHDETNPMATPVRTLVSKLGLEDTVQLLGWVPDVDLPVLYQNASVFLFPSRYEGFGLPVLEAFASGTPVITTAEGSLAELARDAALIVSPDDVDGLVRAIHSLNADDHLRRTLQMKGKERSGQYTWSEFASSATAILLQ